MSYSVDYIQGLRDAAEICCPDNIPYPARQRLDAKDRILAEIRKCEQDMAPSSDYTGGQWEGFNRVLALLQTYDTKQISKSDLYHAIMDMRPTSLKLEEDELNTDSK